MSAEALRIQQEVDAKQEEINLMNEEIKLDNTVFMKVKQNVMDKIEQLGKDRLKWNIYNSNGTTKEVFSFHD